MANVTQPVSNKVGTPGAVNLFGSPPNNSNRSAIDHFNYIQTQDATPGTNLVSPLALTTTIVPIVIPNNAVTVRFLPDAIIKVSEVANQSQYFTVPAAANVSFDVCRQGIIYVSAATTANLSFLFQIL
jgi:hypothetical protein